MQHLRKLCALLIFELYLISLIGVLIERPIPIPIPNNSQRSYMSIPKKLTLRSFVRATLRHCGQPVNKHIVNQIVGTAAVESDFGRYWRQMNGPALGIFQMEPRTRKDIIKNYLAYRAALRKEIEAAIGCLAVSDEAFTNSLTHQVIFCYLHYKRFNSWGTNLDEYANSWKTYYNTRHGRGTTLDFKEKYRRYIQ